MAEKHHIRVCAVGGEQDMTHLLRVLLKNAGAIDDEPQEGPPMTREEMEEKVHQLAQWEGGGERGFLYEMLSVMPFGSLDETTSSLTIRQESCGLWTACFDYESLNDFQLEDWLSLHTRCNRMLMAAQYASHTFGLEKGNVLLCGGRAMDRWDNMLETWLWLIHRYECGYPPEEAIGRLAKLKKTMDMEDCDMTVSELLQSCMSVLTEIAASVSDPTELRSMLAASLQKRDFQTALGIQVSVAESVLWQTDHNPKWLANLSAILDAWKSSKWAD